jgi:hypothetical protein
LQSGYEGYGARGGASSKPRIIKKEQPKYQVDIYSTPPGYYDDQEDPEGKYEDPDDGPKYYDDPEDTA